MKDLKVVKYSVVSALFSLGLIFSSSIFLSACSDSEGNKLEVDKRNGSGGSENGGGNQSPSQEFRGYKTSQLAALFQIPLVALERDIDLFFNGVDSKQVISANDCQIVSQSVDGNVKKIEVVTQSAQCRRARTRPELWRGRESLTAEFQKISRNGAEQLELLGLKSSLGSFFDIDFKNPDRSYQIQTKIDLKKSSQTNSLYDFTVSLNLSGSEPSRLSLEITGQAQISQELKKITRLQINKGEIYYEKKEANNRITDSSLTIVPESSSLTDIQCGQLTAQMNYTQNISSENVGTSTRTGRLLFTQTAVQEASESKSEPLVKCTKGYEVTETLLKSSLDSIFKGLRAPARRQRAE